MKAKLYIEVELEIDAEDAQQLDDLDIYTMDDITNKMVINGLHSLAFDKVVLKKPSILAYRQIGG